MRMLMMRKMSWRRGERRRRRKFGVDRGLTRKSLGKPDGGGRGGGEEREKKRERRGKECLE